jgi:hypothetical protein
MVYIYRAQKQNHQEARMIPGVWLRYCLAGAFSALACFARADWYQVEMAVIRHSAAFDQRAGYTPYRSGATASSQPLSGTPVHQLSPVAERQSVLLNDIHRLENAGFTLVGQQTWQQDIDNQHHPVLVSLPGINAQLRLKKGSSISLGLHVQDNNGPNFKRQINIREGEVQYVDDSSLGLLFRLTPISETQQAAFNGSPRTPPL